MIVTQARHNRDSETGRVALANNEGRGRVGDGGSSWTRRQGTWAALILALAHVGDAAAQESKELLACVATNVTLRDSRSQWELRVPGREPEVIPKPPALDLGNGWRVDPLGAVDRSGKVLAFTRTTKAVEDGVSVVRTRVLRFDVATGQPLGPVADPDGWLAVVEQMWPGPTAGTFLLRVHACWGCDAIPYHLLVGADGALEPLGEAEAVVQRLGLALRAASSASSVGVRVTPTGQATINVHALTTGGAPIDLLLDYSAECSGPENTFTASLGEPAVRTALDGRLLLVTVPAGTCGDLLQEWLVETPPALIDRANGRSVVGVEDVERYVRDVFAEVCGAGTSRVAVTATQAGELGTKSAIAEGTREQGLTLVSAGSEPRSAYLRSLTPGPRAAEAVAVEGRGAVLANGEVIDQAVLGQAIWRRGVVVHAPSGGGQRVEFEVVDPAVGSGGSSGRLAWGHHFVPDVGDVVGVGALEQPPPTSVSMAALVPRFAAELASDAVFVALPFPADPIGVGARWTSTAVDPMFGGDAVLVTTYELVGVGENALRVQIGARLTLRSDAIGDLERNVECNVLVHPRTLATRAAACEVQLVQTRQGRVLRMTLGARTGH